MSAESPSAGRSETGKVLGFSALLALGVNGIVGVGIFFTPNQIAALLPGASGALAYLCTTLALVPIACVYALLGARFDVDGGPYVWARAAFGPAAGFFVGWVTYVSSLLASATIILGMCQFMAPSLGFASPLGRLAFGWLSVGALGAVVAAGLRPSAWAWSALSVAKLVPLLVLVALFALSPARPVLQAERAMLIAVFPLQGFEIIPVVAGSALASRRNVPLATLSALLLAATLYVVLQLACAGGVPRLETAEAPLLSAARAYGGEAAEQLVAAGTNVSALGIAFGMIAMTPRYLSALGTNDALGVWLGVETERKVPLRALLVTASAVLLLISVGRFSSILVLASLSVLVQFAVCAGALATLAVRRKYGFQRRHLWPAPLALGAILLIAQAARLVELWILCGVLLAGAGLFGVRSWAGARYSAEGSE
jgi:APA family basic amino acid/polyamine antiporter